MANGREMRVTRCSWCYVAVAIVGAMIAVPAIAGMPDQADSKTTATGKPAEGKNVKGGESIRVEPDQAHQLTVITVKEAPFQSHKSAIGQIAFNDDLSAPVLPQFPGRVLKLLAKVGDVVKAGDPLVEIDSPEILQPQNDFIAAVTSLNKAKAQLNLAQTIESRQRLLFDGKATPLKELQLAEAQLAVAENDLRSAETALDAARSKLRIIGKSEDEIAALQKNGAVTRTSIITAPVSGTIIARKVGPGQYVRADAPDPLFLIADLSSMWLKAYVPENDAPAIRVGQDVDVRVMALPEGVFKARVVAVGASSDPVTHRVMVRSEVPNADGILKADMFASFRINTSAPIASPSVPVESVIRHGEESAVWVELEPFVFKRRLVTLGLEREDSIQINAGLKAGERILSRGAIFVDNEWRQ
jgi:membrane fusion protein, heavy metal efflux system